jgi:hypothetical protein
MINLKLTMNVIAWLSMFWIIWGIYIFGYHVIDSIRFPTVYYPGMIIDGPIYGFVILSGVVVALISGLIARPRFFWPVMIIAGTTCFILALLNMIPLYWRFGTITGSILFCMLGLFCVIGGGLIRWLRIRQNIRSSH